VAAALKGRRTYEAKKYALAIWGAWHQESFARAKKMPKLEALIQEILNMDQAKKARRRVQTPEEVLAIMRQFTKSS
jgi:hypothetical protein